MVRLTNLRECFSDMNVNTGRQDELDIVKGLAIIFMVWCHVYREIGAVVKLKISKRVLFGIAAGMSVLGVLLKDVATGYCFLNLVLGLFWKTQGHAYFTLFHWFIFPAFGMIFGEWLLRCKDKATAYKRLIPIAIPICIVIEGGAILIVSVMISGKVSWKI